MTEIKEPWLCIGKEAQPYFVLQALFFFNAHLWSANIQPLFLAAGLTSFFRCPPLKGGSFSPFPLRSNNRILIHRERDLAY
jgi:hypothetical protein